MTRRWTAHWPQIALHGVAGLALASIALWGSADLNSTRPLDASLESGKWALRFLLLCLAMTPLQTYLGWRGAGRLRKPAGLWAFGFAALHMLCYVSTMQELWLVRLQEPFLVLGVGSLLILTALAVTSNRRAMRWLGQKWKRLHRLVYLAGATTTLHAILAAGASKRVLVRDPQAAHELQLYAALLVVLLAVRIPQLRRRLQTAVAQLRLSRGRAAPVHTARPTVEPAPLPHLPGEERAIPVVVVPPPLYEPAPEMEEAEELVV